LFWSKKQQGLQSHHFTEDCFHLLLYHVLVLVNGGKCMWSKIACICLTLGNIFDLVFPDRVLQCAVYCIATITVIISESLCMYYFLFIYFIFTLKCIARPIKKADSKGIAAKRVAKIVNRGSRLLQFRILKVHKVGVRRCLLLMLIMPLQ
jgi:hypothetical protein